MNMFRVVALLVLFHLPILAKPPRVTGNRVPSRPYITGDGFRACADHVYDETDQTLHPDEVGLGDIVFVRAAMLDAFFKHIHPRIAQRYILVSHNADTATPGKFISHLQDEQLAYWFGQNPTIMHHEKFVPIPIGIANGYVKNLGVMSHFKPYNCEPAADKQFLLGINFKPATNKSERQRLFNTFKAQSFCRDISTKNHINYLKYMHQVKYVLSPKGNGLDCHRTWEALIVGTIPIVKSSTLNELLEGLPVLIIDNWSIVDENLLHEAYDSMCSNFASHGLEKLMFDYWQERLKMCQQGARNQD